MRNAVGCLLLVIACWHSASAQSKELPNRDKSFTLIKNDTTTASGIPLLKYKVIRTADKRMVVEGTATMGVVEWSADYELTESQSLGAGQSSQHRQPRKIDLRPYLIKP